MTNARGTKLDSDVNGLGPWAEHFIESGRVIEPSTRNPFWMLGHFV